jgi:2-(1,2-epoxy-1,2-dihydrophenyl)acetyl-CoA isomerase
MVFTAEPVDAESAFKIGLVEELSPPDQIFVKVESILSRISEYSLSAIRQTKRVIADCTEDPNLSLASDPALPMVKSIQSEDFKKRTQAFLGKRKSE